MRNNSVIEHRFDDRDTMIEALYRVFVEDLQRLPATLLLSGGSTPVPLYRRLSSANLDWSNVNIALVDERWVEVDDDASNERLLRENLLLDRAASANFLGMKNTHENPFDGQDECNTGYALLPRPYSICLLGMGTDGHTASLFPHAQGLEAAIDSKHCCAAMRASRSEVTGDNLERMTLTPWSILQSKRLILLFTGDEKWRVYQRARESALPATFPVSLFIHQHDTPLEVYWAP